MLSPSACRPWSSAVPGLFPNGHSLRAASWSPVSPKPQNPPLYGDSRPQKGPLPPPANNPSIYLFGPGGRRQRQWCFHILPDRGRRGAAFTSAPSGHHLIAAALIEGRRFASQSRAATTRRKFRKRDESPGTQGSRSRSATPLTASWEIFSASKGCFGQFGLPKVHEPRDSGARCSAVNSEPSFGSWPAAAYRSVQRRYPSAIAGIPRCP